jgi:hypothetical protein
VFFCFFDEYTENFPSVSVVQGLIPLIKMLSNPRLPSFSGNISVIRQWLGKLAQTDTS